MLTSPTPAIRRSVFKDWGAPGLVALLCLALAALASPHATRSGYGALTVMALVGTAGVLVWRSRPHHPKAEHLAQSLPALSSRSPMVIQLTTRDAADIGRAGLAYAAVARSEVGEELLAQATDPARVLAVARYWQAHLGVPLVPGWGLKKSDLDMLDAKRPPLFARLEYAGPSQHGLAGSSVALVSSAIALLAIAGSVAVFRDHPAGVVSLALLGVGVSLLAGFAAAARTDFTRIAVGDSVEIERFCLRRSLGGVRLPLNEVRLLAVVSPEGKHGRHLLLASNQGYCAIECPAFPEPVAQGPVIAIRPSQSDAPPQRAERAQRIVSGSGLH